MTLVSELIAAARVRHWSFTDVELGDGAAVLFLNQRQRTHLAQHGAQIEGIVGTSAQYTIGLSPRQAIVAMVNGVPTYSTGVADGFPVHLAAGVPYINTSDVPIAGDPFGASGGTPGFPLPADMVRLINVALVYTNNQVIPCDVIQERARHTWLPGRNPACFVSGNRLVPLLPLSTGNTNDRWNNVLSIQISYVAIQTLAALSDVLTLPAVLCEALTADLALLFAMQSKETDAATRSFFSAEAQRSANAIAEASLNLIESAQQSAVLYRG